MILSPAAGQRQMKISIPELDKHQLFKAPVVGLFHTANPPLLLTAVGGVGSYILELSQCQVFDFNIDSMP